MVSPTNNIHDTMVSWAPSEVNKKRRKSMINAFLRSLELTDYEPFSLPRGVYENSGAFVD